MFRCMVQGSFPAAFVVQGQACLKGKKSHCHRPFLCQFPCFLSADPQVGTSANGIFHLWRVSAEKTLVGTVSTVVDFGRPGLVHSIAVLFKIRPCLCFGTVLCHLAVVFVRILACTLRLCIPPRCLQRCPSSFFFLQKCLCTCCAADRRQGYGAFRMIAANCFCMRSLKSLPTGPEGERHAAIECVNTMFMAGRVCLS